MTFPPSAADSAAEPSTRGRWRALLRWCGALGLLAAAALIGHEAALQTGLWRLREAAGYRLDLLATSLDADLLRFDYLPALLEMTPVVPAMLDTPDDAALRDAVNRYLAGVNAAAGAEMIYVLDRTGHSLAASDWDRPDTTIGQDLSFRPYAIDAIQNGRGRFYGVGITSHKPGYYLSYALRQGGRLRGLVTAKVNIENAELEWRKLPGDVMLIDERGVVILATRDDMRYRPLAPLSPSVRAETLQGRPYGNAPLLPLDWHVRSALGDSVQLVTLDQRDRLASTRHLRRAPWRLVVLDDLAPLRLSARYAAMTASLAMAVLLLAAVTLWQRRRAVRQKLATRAALQAAHDTLESTVVARTAELRAAQNELVHAGKMAALGQMSAVMVHELNQPLTALSTLAESAAILLQQKRESDVRDNLQRITDMVDRLSRLTSQLKTFSHKGDGETALTSVALGRCIADARASVDGELKSHGVALEVDVQPAGLSVVADEAALGSLIVNLMRNAIDAMAGAPQRRLELTARLQPDGSRAVLQVVDTGPGIRADILARLFEPFVSSKPAGAGLGLGLVIASQLVRAVGGQIRGANRPEGGACFTVELLAANPQE